jgi:hypothetical protein
MNSMTTDRQRTNLTCPGGHAVDSPVRLSPCPMRLDRPSCPLYSGARHACQARCAKNDRKTNGTVPERAAPAPKIAGIRAGPHCPSMTHQTIQTSESSSDRNESTAPALNPLFCGVAYTTPAGRIEKSFDDAHVVIADYLEPVAPY